MFGGIGMASARTMGSYDQTIEPSKVSNCVLSGLRQATHIASDSPEASVASLVGSYALILYSEPNIK